MIAAARLIPSTVAAAAFVALALGARAQAPAPAPAPPMIKSVKPGLFMVTGAGGNSTVRVGTDGIILVDTKLAGQQNFDGLMGQIRTVSPAPVKYVIDTHHHGDHTGNNGRFLEAGAQVVAHENLKAQLARFTPPANNPNATAPAQPNVTYKTDYAVRVGDAQAMLHHYSAGHTSGDTVVYFPEVKVVSFGDELVAATPTFDYNGGATIDGWIRSLDAALQLDFDTAIPGHGDNPMTKAEVQAFRNKLATFIGRAREQVKGGTPKDELIAKVRTDDLWAFAPNYWEAPGRLDGLYAEASR
jgi:glyoxylase-like metal-dependent hydrolase (beta-lactamase superfamily II)